MAHSDETDDAHGRSRSHPGCAIVPAAWACGEYFNASGAQFIRSVVLGYDVGTRVLMAMGGPAFSYSSHKSSHSIAGVFGAAATAGSLAGLQAEQMRWMLDYTAQQSSGIASWGRDVDHIEKAFVFGGMPARGGVTSALLVQTGWNGIQDVFSGADNFFEAYAPTAKTEMLIDGLGKRHEVTLTDIKKWTVGSPIQGPLDALELIQAQKSFTADDVTEVIVRLEPSVAKVVDNRDMPDICLQHMMAVMLMDRTASFKAAHDKDRMKGPATLAQRSKVVLVKDEALTALLPVRVAIVEVVLKDGTRLTQKVEAVRGTPRNPMTRQEVIDKATDLMNPVLGQAKTKQLIRTVFELEALPRVQSLRPLLQA
jgi:2-methylcitrate dehydratase PrpD